MNKKVSTLLTVALALGGSLLSTSAFAQNTVVTKPVSGNAYYIATDKADNMGCFLNQGGQWWQDANTNKALWKVNVATNGSLTTYTFTNVNTGEVICFDGGVYKTNVTDTNKATVFTFTPASGKTDFSAAGKFVAVGVSENNVLEGANQSAGAVASLGSTGSSLTLFAVDATEIKEKIGAETLNQTLGGEGLFLGFKDSDKVSDNVFEDTKLKAFYVNGLSGVPEGIYFATEYPSDLNGTSEITNLDDFKKCTFITVTPNSFMNVHKFTQASGHGLKFDKVAASTMNYALASAPADELSQNDEVYVGNACFTVTEKDNVNAAGKYTLSLSNARLILNPNDKETTGDVKQATPANPIYVAAPADLGVNYLVTYESGVEFEAVKGNLVDPSALIKTTKEASYYAIQLVSGEGEEESEYGQYLTTNKANTETGDWYSVPEADVNDPLYQFVVSSIDLTNKTATFTNRETGKKLTFSFYGEVEGLVFNLACTNAGASFSYATDNNGVYGFTKSLNLSAVKVKLIPVTVEDKYASFFNAEEATTMVSFKLAKSDVASEKLYVVADRNDKGVVKQSAVLASETEDDKFVLYKSEDATLLNTNDFAYMDGKNARIATDKDSVAYYSYKVKLYEDNDDVEGWYLGANQLWNTNLDAATSTYVIKETSEGSIYLLNTSTTSSNLSATTSYSTVADNVKEGDDAWSLADNYYDFSDMLNRNVKTYIVPEAPAVSLEAKGQHVAFQAERGGYVSMNENGQAVVAVKAIADEDLTFWLDTADSEKTVPSFLISKGGKFLYNAADSATNLVNGADYVINDAADKYKMIFKAGSLNEDGLLVTTINGKEATLAEKADALKKYTKGLNDFKYRIVKTEDEGYYFICPVGKGGYVQNLNGELTTTTDKKEALRVLVEAMEAPTSNESVSTSEVKVVAQDGAVVVKNAAGKNVVVSTILGQVVVNEVLTSDNATINVPAGIVVVAVEGESFKVNVK